MSSNGRNGVVGVATSTIDAFRQQPLMLLVVILNVLMLFLIGFSVRTAQANSHAILQLALEKCGPQR